MESARIICGWALAQDSLAFPGRIYSKKQSCRSCVLSCELLCRQDIIALKRLQRDAFEQMLRLTERLDELQERPEALGGDRSAGATALFGSAAVRPGRSAVTDRAPLQVSGKLIYMTGLQFQVSSPLARPAVPCRPWHMIRSRHCASEHSHEHAGCCNRVCITQSDGYLGTKHAVSTRHSTQLAQAGKQERSNYPQQMPESGPELRLRLESTDPDSGRSLTALLGSNANEGSPQLRRVRPAFNTLTLAGLCLTQPPSAAEYGAHKHAFDCTRPPSLTIMVCVTPIACAGCLQHPSWQRQGELPHSAVERAWG